MCGKKTYAEPSLAVLGLNLVPVAHPVSVPPPQSGRVVNTDGVNALDLEASALERVDEPAEGGRGIGTGEDVFVHEQTPDEVLVLPRLSETGNLQEEDTIVVHHVGNLRQELAEVTDTDVLGHLQTGDLVVAALGDGDVSVVHAQDVALLLGDTSLAQGVVAPGSLVAAEGDTGSLGAVVDTGKAGEGAPATADIQEPLVLLEADLLAHDGQLVVLELLEALLPVDVGDDAGGVDHARAQEPAVEVITAVVVVANLLLVCFCVLSCQQCLLGIGIGGTPLRFLGGGGWVGCAGLTLRPGVHDELGNHAGKEELDQTNGEAEACPVMPVLENLEAVTVEVDVTVKVHLMEGLHGDLVLALVFCLVLRLLEGEVVLDGLARVFGLLVLAGAVGGDDEPEGTEKGEGGEDGQEDGRLGATAELP